MALLTFARVIIPGFILLGVQCLHIFGEANGTFPQIISFRDKRQLPTPTSSGTNTSTFPESFTGFDPPDGLLSTLVVFFWPLVDGSSPDASLISFLFAGQAVALLTAIALEASRTANHSRIVSFTTVYGILFQSIGAGVIAPSYLTIYLFTSPLVTSTAALTPLALSINEGILAAHPFGVLIGYIVPTILMALPAPEIISQNSKVTAIVVWQFFPVWTSICTFMGKVAFASTKPYASQSDALRRQIACLRTVYKLALAISVPAHIATWTLSFSTVLFPGLFEAHTVEAFHPSNVIIPPNPFGAIKAESVAQGAHWFLQYDYLITSLVYLIWAMVSRYGQNVKCVRSETRRFGIGSILDVTARCVVLGPMATALTLLWDRDEIGFASVDTKAIKKTA